MPLLLVLLSIQISIETNIIIISLHSSYLVEFSLLDTHIS